MNVFHLLVASTLVSTVMSWHHESSEKLIASWSDEGDRVRVSLYEESTSTKWPHRMVLEVDGNVIRKWGRWEDGIFTGSPLGAMPNSVSGTAELLTQPIPRGLLFVTNLRGHGVDDGTQLLFEVP